MAHSPKKQRKAEQSFQKKCKKTLQTQDGLKDV